MHGGGLVLGSVAMDDARCIEIVEQLNIVVASVEYRLAPAFPYPVPLDDCYAGLEWLFGSAEALGSRRRVASRSAAAVPAVVLRPGWRCWPAIAGSCSPCFQLLRYPMIDDRNTTASSHEVTDLRVWNRSANIVGWGAYLGDAAGSDDVSHYAAADARDRSVGFAARDRHRRRTGHVPRRGHRVRAASAGCGRLHGAARLRKCVHGSDALVPHAEASQRWKRDEMAALGRALNS